MPSNKPSTSGLIEHDWARFTTRRTPLIFTLKNSKVYMGLLLFADYRDDIPESQRSIRIKLLKSGVRDSMGEVTYTTHYLTDVPDLEDPVYAKVSFDPDDWMQIPELVIFQREIVSYTEYNALLDNRFGHSSLKKSPEMDTGPP